ncbi:bacillithiol transferase BstA [soil metagenome]
MLEVYPIARVEFPTSLDLGTVMLAIDRIEALPVELRAVVDGCGDLDHPIREGAWSIRHLVHHVGDSHLNAFVRTKLLLTEDGPTVRPYDEVAWSRLADGALPPDPSLALVSALHVRWVEVLRSMSPADLERPWTVPGGTARPAWRIPLTYAWHGMHHVAQIRQAREHFAL